MGRDVLPARIDAEVVAPYDVVDLAKVRLAQGMEDVVEVGVARDDVDRPAWPQYPLGLPDPCEAELSVAVSGNLDVPVEDEPLVPVVVLVQPVAVDAVGGGP